VDSLSIQPKNQPIKESLKAYNTFNMPSDGVKPFEVTKAHTIVSGSNSNLKADKTTTISADAEVKGVVFAAGSAIGNGPVVRVKAGVRAVFSGCTFRREDESSTASMIFVEDGGEAVFSGCTFVNGSKVFDHDGVADNIQVIGSSKRNIDDWGVSQQTASF
jgi:hypothetical protein